VPRGPDHPVVYRRWRSRFRRPGLSQVGFNTIGFDGRLAGRQRAERKAGDDKGVQGTFRGSFLSALDCVFGFIDFSLFGEGRAPPSLEAGRGGFKRRLKLPVGELLERLQDFAAAGVDTLVNHGRYYTLHHGQVTWGVIPISFQRADAENVRKPCMRPSGCQIAIGQLDRKLESWMHENDAGFTARPRAQNEAARRASGAETQGCGGGGFPSGLGPAGNGGQAGHTPSDHAAIDPVRAGRARKPAERGGNHRLGAGKPNPR
jgi:hypothetical protein